MEIKAILFDLGHVIVDLNVAKTYEKLKTLTGVDYNMFASEEESIFIKYETGKISEELFINGLIKISKKNVQARELLDAWNAMLLGVQKETIDLIESLKTTYDLFIYSNTNHTHITWLTSYLERTYQKKNWFDAAFNKAYYSHTLGHRKPNADGFNIIKEALSYSASQVVFIDDHIPNVQAALDAGFQGIHKPPTKALQEVLKENGLV